MSNKVVVSVVVLDVADVNRFFMAALTPAKMTFFLLLKVVLLTLSVLTSCHDGDVILLSLLLRDGALETTRVDDAAIVGGNGNCTIVGGRMGGGTNEGCCSTDGGNG